MEILEHCNVFSHIRLRLDDGRLCDLWRYGEGRDRSYSVHECDHSGRTTLVVYCMPGGGDCTCRLGPDCPHAQLIEEAERLASERPAGVHAAGPAC